MSHFTQVKTSFKNLEYLKRSLKELNLNYQTNSSTVRDYNSELKNVDLIIPQSNGYNIGFNFDGNEYILISDLSFWDQKWSVEGFLNKLSQVYAHQTILAESAKQGFNNVKEINNVDGSISLTLERWN